MIRVAGYKNGYDITADSTNEEFQSIINSYKKFNCIICNQSTAEHFQSAFMFNNVITINNKIPDERFFINGVY